MKLQIGHKYCHTPDFDNTDIEATLHFTITVSDAALLIALEEGHHNDLPFNDKETQIFKTSREVLELDQKLIITSWKDIVELLKQEPIGKVKKARDEILIGLIESIHSKELTPDAISRDRTGDIEPDDTYLDLHELCKWAMERGFMFDNLIHDYWGNELDIWIASVQQIKERRDLQRRGIQWDIKSRSELEILRSEIIALREQKRELEEQAHEKEQDRPLSSKFVNNLHRIIAVMLYTHHQANLSHPFAIAGIIERHAKNLDIQIRQDAIAERVTEALEYLDPELLKKPK